MDAEVDDFLSEIDKIGQPKQPPNKEVWKECQDELTGYTYYWNTITDEVTWKAPPEFQSNKKETPHLRRLDSTQLSHQQQENKKIPPPEKPIQQTCLKVSKKPQKRPYNPESESEDEKIELITSYGSDSESEDDNRKQKKQDEDVAAKKIKCEQEHNTNDQSDDEDNLDLLAKIHKRAQELKEMGGELPPEVEEVKIPEKETKLSLVAGYSDSEDEENDEITTPVVLQPKPLLQGSHSTLFPITQPIDVKDFEQKVEEEKKDEEEKITEFDSKGFQRKKRIGVALINTAKKKDPVGDDDEVKHGFGYSGDSINPEKGSMYPGFAKGGVMFVKSDVLNPTTNTQTEPDDRVKETKPETLLDKTKIEEMYSTLIEKLGFLNGAHPSVPPTQTMVIQAETLFVAMKNGGLKLSYLDEWLNDTCSELVKLEKEATPEGWLLLWDRAHKRYYYQNRSTGVSQWEYPQPDVQNCDDAMDISTTPPPEQVITMSPPQPPSIRCPSPPPPPIISGVEVHSKTTDILIEPLPPGVEVSDVPSNKIETQEEKSVDPLNSALDSFYSDIAAIKDPSPSNVPALPVENNTLPENSLLEQNQDTSKKKKKKVKLVPGLALKKKGVSKLVEKWMDVQQRYND